MSKAVISVGKEEIQKMIDDGEPIEVNCHFCNSHYTFTVDENNKKITAKNTQNDVLIYSVSSLSENELVLVNSEGSDTTKYTFSK